MVNLNNAKVGDLLLVSNSFGRWHIEVVTKILKLHVATDKNNKYRKCDGTILGGNGYYTTYAKLTTEDEIAILRDKEQKRIEFNEAVFKASKIEFKRLSIEQLNAIIEIAQANK